MNNANETLLRQILDSNLEELLQHDIFTTKLPQRDRFYLKVLINYLKGDHHEIENWLSKIKELLTQTPDDKTLSGAYFSALVRLRIRKNEVQQDELEEISQMSFPLPWNCEVSFVLGMAFMRLEKFEKSAELFFKSYSVFSEYGCRRKALIAYQNHVVANVNLHPNKSYLAEWSLLVKLARQEKVTSMEGGALINLSREYQNVGSFEPALKTIDEALVSLFESIGTYQYYHALLQKCDILLLLGKNHEASQTYQLAKLCPFLELKSSIALLERKIDPDKTMSNIQMPESLPWKERFDDMKSGKKTKAQGSLVQLLIHELEQEPQDKFSLIDKLYPENLDFEIKENRFNVLLSKVRKQYPGLICKDGSLYKLEMTTTWLKKKIS